MFSLTIIRLRIASNVPTAKMKCVKIKFDFISNEVSHNPDPITDMQFEFLHYLHLYFFNSLHSIALRKELLNLLQIYSLSCQKFYILEENYSVIKLFPTN